MKKQITFSIEKRKTKQTNRKWKMISKKRKKVSKYSKKRKIKNCMCLWMLWMNELNECDEWQHKILLAFNAYITIWSSWLDDDGEGHGFILLKLKSS